MSEKRSQLAFLDALGLTALLLAFWLTNDFLLRLDALLRWLSPLELALNLAFMVALLLPAALLAATIGWLLGRASRSLGLLWFWSLLGYLGAVYFRMHCVLDRHALDVDVTRIDLGTFALLVVGLFFFPLARRFSSHDHRRLGWAGRCFLRALVPLTLAGLLTAAVLGRPAAAPPTAAKSAPDILLVSFDSLGTSHMSLYGYPRPTTPFLEKWSRQCFVFDRMVSATNYTHITLVSFLGRLPHGRGFESDGQEPLPLLFQRAGYETHYFTHAYPPASFRRGWDKVHMMQTFQFEPAYQVLARTFRPAHLEWLADFLSEDERFYALWATRNPRDLGGFRGQPFPTPTYFAQAVQRMRESDRPCLIWIHAWEPHNSYSVPRPWLGHWGTSEPDRYDGAVAYADFLMQNLVRSLRINGLEKSTVVAMTSDHGEGHGEPVVGDFRGVFHYSNWVNPAVNSVPFVLHLPGQTTGARVRLRAQTVDIAPTLARLAGLEIPPDWEGISLVPYLREPDRTSSRVVVVAPASFFLRRFMRMDKVPPHWLPSGAEEIFNAYLGEYRFVWKTHYAGDGPFYRRPERMEFYGLYRGKGPNLIHRPDARARVQALFERPEMKRYRGPLQTWEMHG